MATIRDVARRSGVSTTTVSFVLNGTGSVGAEARQRVLQAARDLEYRPNPLARAMITRRTRTLGVLVNNASSFNAATMLDGVEATARSAGYEILLAVHRDEPQTALSAIRDLTSRRVDAIIAVFSKADDHPEVLAALPATGVPYVIAFYRVAQSPIKGDVGIDNIVVDQEQGAFLATHYLIHGCGRRRLAFAGGPENRNATRQRRRGFWKAASEANLTVGDEQALYGEFEVTAGEAMGRRLLDLPMRVDGVFAGDDAIAAGLLRAFRRGGLRVPEDIAVVGFNNCSIAAATDPALTTVEMPLVRVGEACVQRMIARLEAPDEWQPEPLALPCRLVIRESA